MIIYDHKYQNNLSYVIKMSLIFHTITPAKFGKYQEQIDCMHQKITTFLEEPSPDEFDNNTCVYILCTKGQGEIIGGARLMPSRLSKSLPQLLIASELCIKHPQLWECNKVFLASNNKKYISHDHKFFQGLYCSLSDFAVLHSLQGLITFNQAKIHKSIKKFGNWPFRSEAFITHDNKEYIISTLLTEKKSQTPLQKNS